MPDYAKGALGVGARGGEGVMLAHRDGQWSGPAFYDFGGVSVGAQVGVEAGQIAMVLMSDEAVEAFHSTNNFSLNADAGLTLIDWSARAQGSLGKGDVVVWSDAEGAFAGADVSVTDIRWDAEENERVHGGDMTSRQILASASVDDRHAQKLQAALQETGTATGLESDAGRQADVESDRFRADELETDTDRDTGVEATTARTDYEDTYGDRTDADQAETDLPATGSELPLFALLGLLSVAAAIGVRSLVR